MKLFLRKNWSAPSGKFYKKADNPVSIDVSDEADVPKCVHDETKFKALNAKAKSKKAEVAPTDKFESMTVALLKAHLIESKVAFDNDVKLAGLKELAREHAAANPSDEKAEE